MKAIILILAVLTSPVGAAEFKAGVARKAITPAGPVWMSGYASRTHASEGVIHDLWAKALAIEDPAGRRVVIVTTDLIGLPREVSTEIAARVKKQYGLERSQVLLCVSHTHSGPVVWPNLKSMYDLVTPAERECLEKYARRLSDDLVSLVGAAMTDLAPAQVSTGHGSVGFAINRRQALPKGYAIGQNPKGPVDHDVPVVKIAALDGKLRAVLFGYACHNTTLGGDLYRINGDYAGFAEIELEKAVPGATAMFTILCGADQNPSPRGKVELAAQHGKALAEEVRRVLAGPLSPVRPPVRTAYEDVKLAFAPQPRSKFEEEAKSKDRFRRHRADAMLAAFDAGQPVRDVPLPVQVVRLGSDLAIVALGGEVVVDYSLRLKREFAGTNLIVVGYANEVMCYIPSRRVLREGGYEGGDAMIYYGLPGPFTDGVEETVIGACRRLFEQTSATPR
jgi:hypothetical protein